MELILGFIKNFNFILYSLSIILLAKNLLEIKFNKVILIKSVIFAVGNYGIDKYGGGLIKMVLMLMIPLFYIRWIKPLPVLQSVGYVSLIKASVSLAQVLIAIMLYWILELFKRTEIINNIPVAIFLALLSIFLIYIVVYKATIYISWKTIFKEKANLLVCICLCAILLIVPYGVVYFDDSTEIGTAHVILFIVEIMAVVIGSVWLIAVQSAAKKAEMVVKDNHHLSAQLHKSKEMAPVILRALEKVQKDGDNNEEEEQGIKEMLESTKGIYESIVMDNDEDSLRAKMIKKTGMRIVDEMLEMYLREAISKNISFDLMIGEIDKKAIREKDLLQILGDLIRNAIRAIEQKNEGTGSIFICLGKADGEILNMDVYDDGKEFSLEVLARFGEPGVTTGGTGYGISTLLELLHKYKASYLLKEIAPGTDIFSKCMSISFDKKDQRMFLSYRTEEVKLSNIWTNIEK